MNKKSITPVLGENSFSCPHCGANSHQTWYRCYLSAYDKDRNPWIPDKEFIERLRKNQDIEHKAAVITFLEKLHSRKLFREVRDETAYLKSELSNLSISRCYSCEDYAVWIADALLYPAQPTEFQAHSEMPPDVLLDFTEASSIVDKSPRGAAALLRLAIQRLMPHLGCNGKNLDEDIGALVKRGLDSRVQKALDVVRVIGNNAVHPGQVDLRDDKAIAVKLFDLVDLIVEAMIATPKHIEKMYGQLPEGALNAISKRDGDV